MKFTCRFLTLILFYLLVFKSQAKQIPSFSDTTLAYSMPLLYKMPTGNIMMTWTEKNQANLISFCMATSSDNGKNFGDKNLIFASNGIGSSKLMKPKILFRKDGSLIAVFSNRAEVAGKRAIDIVYCESKNEGKTWTLPVSVDTDPSKVVRGFFDAVVLPNNELAVVYLKDVANSTKHEERDLRLVLTKNGVFQPEKVIDPVVCDCCNISLLLDAKGTLNIYYRDNNDDIRDMAVMTSTDNGQSFSAPKIIHTDNWKISGCPHSGATSSTSGAGTLVAWFSGTDKSESGIRLVNQSGKKLLTLGTSAKNAYLLDSPKASVLVWEEPKTVGVNSQVAFKKIKGEQVSETIWIDQASNATNASGLVTGDNLLVAYEVKKANKRNAIELSTVKL